MRRGLSRNTIAILAASLILIVAGGQVLAGSASDSPSGVPGVAHKLPAVASQGIPSRTGEYRLINANERSLDIIVGSDDRQQVTNTSNFPNSSVTYIEAWNEDEEIAFLCTAAFVGPNVLLTAAHCLWIPEFGGFPDGLAVVPGLNGEDMPFGYEFASELWVPNGWQSANGNINQAWESDYGLIVLDNRSLSREVGEFTVNVLDRPSLMANDFTPSTAGYPGDKTWGTQWFGSSDKFLDVEANLLVHDIDAFQGQSGSPVWRGSDLGLVGVISFESGRHNYARRITSGVMNDLNAACRSMGCSINQTGAGDPEPTPTAEPTVSPTTEPPAETAEPSPTSTSTAEPQPTATSEPQPTATEELPPAQGDVGAFQRTWMRTDDPVANGIVSRTWMWGPAFTEIMVEPYDESGGYRTVLYHEKSRMEITHPDGDPSSIWYVTNGLIAKELITGKMQVGDSRFEDRAPAAINVAGDANDPDGPTYASFLNLLDDQPFAEGSTITATVDRAGNVGDDPSLATEGVTAAQFAPETNHTVASVFWDFMNASGVVYDGGGYREDLLFQNPYFATGLPITEPYWTSVRVGGTERTVLVQVFERRVLTYTPGNPPGWDVEAGNVGLHYYEWRYNTDGPESQEPPSSPEPAPEPPGADEISVAVCLDGGEHQFLSLINAYRAENGLGPLSNSATLNAASYRHSEDMGTRGFFDHENPDGLHSWDRAQAAGYTDYGTVGENIFAGAESSQAVFDGWKASPSHNDAMLDGDFNAIGIGRVFVEGSEWDWYWTTVFGDVVDAAPDCG
ncbi:MAG: CAP domain-containing protein [Thermomicrobiales bacterium]